MAATLRTHCRSPGPDPGQPCTTWLPNQPRTRPCFQGPTLAASPAFPGQAPPRAWLVWVIPVAIQLGGRARAEGAAGSPAWPAVACAAAAATVGRAALPGQTVRQAIGDSGGGAGAAVRTSGSIELRPALRFQMALAAAPPACRDQRLRRTLSVTEAGARVADVAEAARMLAAAALVAGTARRPVRVPASRELLPLETPVEILPALPKGLRGWLLLPRRGARQGHPRISLPRHRVPVVGKAGLRPAGSSAWCCFATCRRTWRVRT